MEIASLSSRMRVNAYLVLARIVERALKRAFRTTMRVVARMDGDLICSPARYRIQSLPLSLLSSIPPPPRLGVRKMAGMETRVGSGGARIRGSVAGKIEDRSIIRLRITSRLDTSADESDQSATPLSAGFRFIGERAVNSAVIFPPIGCMHFSLSNQIARGKKFIYALPVFPLRSPRPPSFYCHRPRN